MGGFVLSADSSLARACSARSSSSGIMPWDSWGEDFDTAFIRALWRRRRKTTKRAMVRTAGRPMPTPIPTFAPVLRLLAFFLDASGDGEAEAGMEETPDERPLLVVVVDEVGDGATVFRDVVVEVAVALVVTAIVYPAFE